MNAKSLAYSHVINQDSSWIDDPFDLKPSFTGVKNVQTLNNYAQDLIANYAHYIDEHYELDFCELPEQDQNELVRLFLEENGRETSECVYGNDLSIESDFTCAILSMLQNDCKETREKFADTTRKNIIIYHLETLQKLLDETCDNYLYVTMNEKNYYAYTDVEHGDITWRKL